MNAYGVVEFHCCSSSPKSPPPTMPLPSRSAADHVVFHAASFFRCRPRLGCQCVRTSEHGPSASAPRIARGNRGRRQSARLRAQAEHCRGAAGSRWAAAATAPTRSGPAGVGAAPWPGARSRSPRASQAAQARRAWCNGRPPPGCVASPCRRIACACRGAETCGISPRAPDRGNFPGGAVKAVTVLGNENGDGESAALINPPSVNVGACESPRPSAG